MPAHCVFVCMFGLLARVNILLICVSSAFLVSYWSLCAFLFMIERIFCHICYRNIFTDLLILENFSSTSQAGYTWVSSYSMFSCEMITPRVSQAPVSGGGGLVLKLWLGLWCTQAGLSYRSTTKHCIVLMSLILCIKIWG